MGRCYKGEEQGKEKMLTSRQPSSGTPCAVDGRRGSARGSSSRAKCSTKVHRGSSWDGAAANLNPLPNRGSTRGQTRRSKRRHVRREEQAEAVAVAVAKQR
uniref:Uncharacterized protein n=1 Tax=Oryza rufipogon TaxID=4529 RepID=A0A0E0QMY9_ORYRU